MKTDSTDASARGGPVLERELEEYCARSLTPLHMPGHKRRLAPAPGLPYATDLTELPGLDDLHDAHGIIARSQERTASLYGAAKTFYLVNGSTCGILAAIRAAAYGHGEMVAAANCHRSVFNAIELCRLNARLIYPPAVPGFGVCGSVDPAEVEAALSACPDAACVVITSPTYEGVVSDVEAIARACHSRGVPLIVDEAHGAHLGLPFSGYFPRGAVECGADAVIQSAHKTLPSLTQTAWLHLKNGLLSEDEVSRQLDIFETSSPSYPLMASLDGCTGILIDDGERLFSRWAQRLDGFYALTASLTGLRVLRGSEEGIFAFDRSKLLIEASGAGMTGRELADILRSRFGFETEMSCGGCVLALTGLSDADDDLRRFARALLALDVPRREKRTAVCPPPAPGVCVRGIAEALTAKAQDVTAGEIVGREAGEYVFAYPPGVPILVPGRRISADCARYLRSLEASGTILRHSHAHGGAFRVVAVDNDTPYRVE